MSEIWDYQYALKEVPPLGMNVASMAWRGEAYFPILICEDKLPTVRKNLRAGFEEKSGDRVIVHEIDCARDVSEQIGKILNGKTGHESVNSWWTRYCEALRDEKQSRIVGKPREAVKSPHILLWSAHSIEQINQDLNIFALTRWAFSFLTAVAFLENDDMCLPLIQNVTNANPGKNMLHGDIIKIKS